MCELQSVLKTIYFNDEYQRKLKVKIMSLAYLRKILKKYLSDRYKIVQIEHDLLAKGIQCDSVYLKQKYITNLEEPRTAIEIK